MSKMKIECPLCGHTLRVADSLAGKSGRCPNCEKRIEIPSDPEETSQAPKTPQPPPPSAPPRFHSESHSQPSSAEESCGHTVLTTQIDRLVSGMRFVGGIRQKWHRYVDLVAKMGLWGMLLIGVITAINRFAIAGSNITGWGFVFAAGAIVVAAVLHYTASKVLNSCMRTIDENSYCLATSTVPDVIGVLAGLAGVMALIGGIQFSTTWNEWPPALWGLGLLVVFGHIALFALNSEECLNISVNTGKVSAGEETVTAAELVPKMGLAIAPILLGYGILVGATLVFAHSLKMWTSTGVNVYAAYQRVSGAVAVSILAALTPVMMYVLHLLISLILDTLKAINDIADNTM